MSSVSEAQRIQRIYDRRAARYDASHNPPWLEALYADVFGRSEGDVLELGVGTGATFVHYPADLASLTGLDVSEAMLARARPKAAGLPYPVRLEVADVQTLPFSDASFDTVTSAGALCGIPDPGRLFAEIRRVLRPGGRLLALEHIRPSTPIVGGLADIADPLCLRLQGCHVNRATPDLLRSAGYSVTILHRRLLTLIVTLVAVPESAEPQTGQVGVPARSSV